MRLKTHEAKKGRVEIIPMIDVVFFLLVFSMLSALSMAEINRLQSDVPKTGSGSSGGEVNRVTVNDIKGKVFLTIETPTDMRQQQMASVDQIGPAVATLFKSNPKLVVLINADDTLPFNEGAQLVDQVKGTGAPLVVPAGT